MNRGVDNAYASRSPCMSTIRSKLRYLLALQPSKKLRIGDHEFGAFGLANIKFISDNCLPPITSPCVTLPEGLRLAITRRDSRNVMNRISIRRIRTAESATKFWTVAVYSISCECMKTDKLRRKDSGRKKSKGRLVLLSSTRRRAST